MSEQLIHTKVEPPAIRRSRRGLRGQKPPLKIKEIWAIRIRLQLEERIRDLAMFNPAIDSKLRACDLTALKVDDVAMRGRVRSRAIVIQKKTGRPVQFEITEQTRDTVARWIGAGGLRHGGFLFPSRICAGRPIRTRQYPRLVSRWISSLGLNPARYGTHSLRRMGAHEDIALRGWALLQSDLARAAQDRSRAPLWSQCEHIAVPMRGKNRCVGLAISDAGKRGHDRESKCSQFSCATEQ
jgi:integrase